MDQAQLEAMCRELPIFPLPRLVLMPGELLPLHVFEPRYRELVKYCQEREGVMGIATIRAGEPSDSPAPSVYPEVGVGEIVACQPYPDGRSTIVLQFVGRCEIDVELDSSYPFRLVQGATSAADPTGSASAILRLRTLVLQLGSLSEGATDEARRLVDLDGAEMLDSLARKLLRETDERRAYLSASHVGRRVQMVEDKLAQFLQVASPTARA